MPVGDFNPAPKPDKPKRIKPKQKHLGDISDKVDKELRARSNEVCELRVKCRGAQAVERAHTTGRRIIPHKTTVEDLFHLCKYCHIYLDQTVEGIRLRKAVREIGTTQYIKNGRRLTLDGG